MVRGLIISLALLGTMQAQILSGVMSSGPTATPAHALIFGGNAASGSTRYLSITGNSTTEANAQIFSPITGTVTGVEVSVGTAPSSTDVFSFRIGGSAQFGCTVATSAHTCSGTGSGAITKGSSLLVVSAVVSDTTSVSIYLRVEGVSGLVATLPLFTLSSYANSSTRYWAIGNNNATQTVLRIGSPISGTLTDIQAASGVASGVTSETVTIYDVTTSQATCAVLNTNFRATCTGLTGTLVKGDLINAGANNTSGSASKFSAYALVTVPTNVRVLPMWNNSSIAASTTGWFSGGATSTGAETDVAVKSVISGIATEMYCMTDVAAAGTGTVFTFNIAGSPTALTCTETSGNSTCSVTGQNVPLNRGKLISNTLVNSNTTTATFAGCYLRVE